MDEKYLLYESQAAPDDVSDDGEEQESLLVGNTMWLWNDRLFLIEHKHDSKGWYFTALDLITNETRPVHFQKSDSKFRQVKVITLNWDYGFIIESFDGSICVNLVKLNWASGEFQLIERLDQQDLFSGILMDKLSPTKFILQYEDVNEDGDGHMYTYQACTLDSGKIEVVDTCDSQLFEHYFNNKMFLFHRGEQFMVDTYDWTTKKEQTLEINELSGVDIDGWCFEWVRERLYTAVCFDDTGTHGIAYIDLETKNWNFLDLNTDLRISKTQFFNGNLLIYAGNNERYDDIYEHGSMDNTYCSEFKIYSIPVQHPQSLRKMAWQLVVQQFKRDESITDPYQAAARFLPFNSDLRPPWYKEEAALEGLNESASNGQGQEQSEINSSENTMSQKSSDAVSSKRTKFN